MVEITVARRMSSPQRTHFTSLHFTCAPLIHSLKPQPYTANRQDSRLRVWETLDAEIKAAKERKAAESSEGGGSDGRGPGARRSGGKAATFRVCASDLEDGATLYLHMVAPEGEGEGDEEEDEAVSEMLSNPVFGGDKDKAAAAEKKAKEGEDGKGATATASSSSSSALAETKTSDSSDGKKSAGKNAKKGGKAARARANAREAFGAEAVKAFQFAVAPGDKGASVGPLLSEAVLAEGSVTKVKGLVCAVLSDDGKDGGDKWFRCRIIEELEKNKMYRVRLLDYGSLEDVPAEKVSIAIGLCRTGSKWAEIE